LVFGFYLRLDSLLIFCFSRHESPAAGGEFFCFDVAEFLERKPNPGWLKGESPNTERQIPSTKYQVQDIQRPLLLCLSSSEGQPAPVYLTRIK
jgi:hypothetical protein